MLVLGIDTGGTYTDGVIVLRGQKEVICTAKALTTPEDLAVGMENCIHALPFDRWKDIGLVCLSTTLATNAIVEGKGCRVGLVLLGKRPAGTLPAEMCVQLDARMDIRGGISENMNWNALDTALLSLKGKCDAVAVSGYASVRNPEHEIMAAKRANELLRLPVVCGHEMSDSLGFYERTVTAVLNARLIPIVSELIKTVRGVIGSVGISAPVMVVRGDGSLMWADYAIQRPVETVLSGPAASVTGAKYLSGCDNCVVVDIGGTTTDIACLKDGECSVSSEGARLAGWRTRVRALEICTFGLGGDSRIAAEDDTICIGPERVVPLCRCKGSEDRCGLTPTDILHATGEYRRWDTQASEKGLKLFSAQLGTSAEHLQTELRREITSYCAAYCREGMTELNAGDTETLVGVGAPARVWLKDTAEILQRNYCVPRNAEVANAIGAAVGQIRETSKAIIRNNKKNGTYYVYAESGRERAETLKEAKKFALESAKKAAERKAYLAGVGALKLMQKEYKTQDEHGNLIELCFQITASGYPK